MARAKKAVTEMQKVHPSVGRYGWSFGIPETVAGGMDAVTAQILGEACPGDTIYIYKILEVKRAATLLEDVTE